MPPGGLIHGFVDFEADGCSLFVLFNNLHPIETDKAVVFDTKISGLKTEELSKCARVDLFTDAIVYSINSKNRNILLKYKGGCIVECRDGGGIGRVGFLGKLSGRKFGPNILDYNTNIQDMKILHTYSTASKMSE